MVTPSASLPVPPPAGSSDAGSASPSGGHRNDTESASPFALVYDRSRNQAAQPVPTKAEKPGSPVTPLSTETPPSESETSQPPVAETSETTRSEAEPNKPSDSEKSVAVASMELQTPLVTLSNSPTPLPLPSPSQEIAPALAALPGIALNPNPQPLSVQSPVAKTETIRAAGSAPSAVPALTVVPSVSPLSGVATASDTPLTSSGLPMDPRAERPVSVPGVGAPSLPDASPMNQPVARLHASAQGTFSAGCIPIPSAFASVSSAQPLPIPAVGTELLTPPMAAATPLPSPMSPMVTNPVSAAPSPPAEPQSALTAASALPGHIVPAPNTGAPPANSLLVPNELVLTEAIVRSNDSSKAPSPPVGETNPQNAVEQRDRLTRLLTVGEPLRSTDVPVSAAAPRPAVASPVVSDRAAPPVVAAPAAPAFAGAASPSAVGSGIRAVSESSPSVSPPLPAAVALAAKATEPSKVAVPFPEPTGAQATPSNPTEAVSAVSDTASKNGADNRPSEEKPDNPESPAPAETEPGAFASETTRPLQYVAETKAGNAAPSVSSPVERAQLMEQVTRHLETMRFAQGHGELSLRLNPEHLGSVHLTISANADGVTARIVTETTQAQRAMEHSRDQLREALEQRGLRLDTLEVSVGQGAVSDGRTAFAGNSQMPFERSGYPASTRSTRMPKQVEETVPVQAAPDSGRIAQTSRLDYRA